ncbi:hypothetical protein GE061_015975 [Apolygus lucorum]|uniref:Uncharacterized protein n=1 Tax=Apolygus lucorum TaxID=248454 RepID=A0A8S9XG39_APOLU|nr:hypothetical protein GE061_015975 [Apolygus lucorum]
MSNIDDNEDGSDEDMFSPKKNRCKIETPIVQTVNQPGCKDRLVNSFKRMLTGVPPPPDYTNPDFNLDKMLTHWKDNQNLIWHNGNRISGDCSEEGNSTLGICLNTDDSCEELELLGRQICERFIWSETSAVTSSVYVKLTQSAKKRRKANGWGLSPRTRISYLTRRMTTFQKDNIAAAVASNKTAQILIAKGDNKKGSSGKCDFKGKRALFQSPENQNKYRTPEQGKDKKLVRRLLLHSSPQGSDKSNCSSDLRSAKSSEKKRCSRSLFSSKTEEDCDRSSTPTQNQQGNALSTQHRQKMLWAVSNALKAVKIRMTDPEFKTFAGPLFKATAEKWRASLNSPAGDKKSSTSDAMLAASKSLVEGITGRKMSPKSAKKNPTPRMRMKTPDNSGKRDENSPPPVTNPGTPIIKDSSNGGVFPLEHVGVLAEKLDPGGNTYSFGTQMTNPTRKRKLEDDKDIEPSSILLSPRTLRMRTPSKTTGHTPKKLTFHSSVVDGNEGTPFRPSNHSPLAKKRKLACSTTPTKVEATPSPSPRVLRTRTPSKLDSTAGSLSNGGTSKKSSSSPLKSPSFSGHLKVVTPKKTRVSPHQLPTISENLEMNNSTPIKSQIEDVEMDLLSPSLRRTRACSKMSEYAEVNSRRVTPKKLRKSPHMKNVESCSKDIETPSKSLVEVKGILISPRFTRNRTPSRVADIDSSRRTPKKVLFAAFDQKDGNNFNQPIPCELGLSKSSWEESERVTEAPLQHEGFADRIPDIKFPEIPIECEGNFLGCTSKKLFEITSPLKISLGSRRSDRKTSQTSQEFADVAMNNETSKPIPKDVGYLRVKTCTLKAKKNYSASIQNQDDPLPPVLRPENVTFRRSSRRCSTEIAPPVLKIEVSEGSPPPIIQERL